jgi:hypothetical protein
MRWKQIERKLKYLFVVFHIVELDTGCAHISRVVTTKATRCDQMLQSCGRVNCLVKLRLLLVAEHYLCRFLGSLFTIDGNQID